MYRITFAAALLAAALAGCSSPKSPAPAYPVAPQVAEPADPCAKYSDDPTNFGRCRLYTGPDAWRFIPLAGRSADLNTQLRCAPYRRNSGPYERCLAEAQQIAGLPPRVLAPTAPRVEPQIEPSAAPRFEPPAQAAPPPASVAVQEPPAQAPIGRYVAPPEMADDAIRQDIIRQSIARYSGSCPCPYNIDRGGRRCGGRSAYLRPGGSSPLCYLADVPPSAVAAYRNTLAAR